MRRSLAVLYISLSFLLLFAVAACSSQEGSPASSGQNKSAPEQPANAKVGSSQASAANGTGKKTDYPTKEINWIIPFSPGSGADTFARSLMKVTEKYLGQKIVPINKEGGSTAIGVSYVLSQPADGYTLFSQSDTLPLLIASGQVPFTEKDIQFINRINADIKVLAVHSKSPLKSYDDFAKFSRANPGKMKIGGVGTKSWSDVFAKKIIQGAGIQATYVPYDGGSKVVAALLGQNLDAIVITGSNIYAQVDAGEIRMLAVSLSERDKKYKDVPTFKELGFKNIDGDLLWRGVFGKKGIPQDRLDVLSAAVTKALKDTEWLDYMKKEQQIDAFMNAQDFTKVGEQVVAEAKQFFGAVKK